MKTMTYGGRQVVNKAELVRQVCQDLRAKQGGRLDRHEVLAEARKRYARIPSVQRNGPLSEGSVDNVLVQWRKTLGCSPVELLNGHIQTGTLSTPQESQQSSSNPTWDELVAAATPRNVAAGDAVRAKDLLDRVSSLLGR